MPSLISESELSAVGWFYITVRDTVVGIVGCPYILEIIQSELSAVGLNQW